MENLTFLSPSWYIGICLLAAFGVASFLYFRTKQYDDQPLWKKLLLSLLRFLGVFGISALLLSPFLRFNTSTTSKPIIVLGVDHSASIPLETSEEVLNTFKSEYANLVADLSKDFEVKQYTFGNSIGNNSLDSFPDKVTNISAFVQHVVDQYNDRNLGAVAIATDGIYNEGKNPIYVHSALNAPIYTIAFGDTTIKRDSWIKRAFHNEIAYLGDQFVVQVDIAANNCKGGRTNLVVSKINGANRKKLQTIPINYNDEEFFNTIEVTLPADEAGVQRYRLSLSPMSNEASTSNNYKDIFVDVLDARQKILIYAKSPHPDLTAFKQILETNKNYEVEVALFPNLKKPIASFDFVILHQLPGVGADIASLISELNEKKIGRLFVLGAQSNIPKFNSVQNVMRIDAKLQNTNEVQAQIDILFNLFNLEDDLKNKLNTFPPLMAPFGEYTNQAGSKILLNQYIGKIETEFPLLAFSEESEIKVGVLAGEGIWKWRLFDYLQHSNHEIINGLVNKTIQYLSLKEDKRKFKVLTSQKIYKENDEIIMDAELYNASYELINEPDVTVSIYNDEGEEFPFTFDRVQNFYSLRAGLFPVGTFRYVARTEDDGQQITFNGKFSIQPIQLESYNTTADHAMLRILAQHRNGEMIFPNQVNSLAEMIRQRSDVKPVVYSNSKTQSLLNLKWIFALLAFILILEWFLRRFFGGY